MDCSNGGDSCCTEDNLCQKGEGDCDTDAQCAGELTCGHNNCVGDLFDLLDDCCRVGTFFWLIKIIILTHHTKYV